MPVRSRLSPRPGAGVPALAGLARLAAIAAVTAAIAAPPAHGAEAPPAAPPAPLATDAQLAAEARLRDVLALAIAHNPELGAARARAEAAAIRTGAADRIPAPELKYEQWGTPLSAPHALDRSQMIMLGVRQSLPAWGTRAARAKVASAEAAGAGADARTRRQDLVAEVRRAYARYFQADHEGRIHREHAQLTAQLVELARAHYQTGRGSQQDVLRLSLELSRLHADLVGIEGDRRASAALLNTLMGRPVDAALGPAPAVAADDEIPELAALDAKAATARAELDAAARSVARGEAALDLARRSARYPTVMVGLDYQYMPMEAHDRHGYGAMLSLGLPWLWGGARDEVAAAERALRAEERTLEAARAAARYELREAAARVHAARELLDAVDRDLLPQAGRAFEAGRAAYVAGGTDAFGLLDSLRSYLQIRIERIRAVGRLQASLADLHRAAGEGGAP
jgi:outer membrane protein TolC